MKDRYLDFMTDEKIPEMRSMKDRRKISTISTMLDPNIERRKTVRRQTEKRVVRKKTTPKKTQDRKDLFWAGVFAVTGSLLLIKVAIDFMNYI